MNSIVCTLFEGHYHYGVAALVNSLYSNGFRGIVYAGYKGELPAWSQKASINSNIDWQGCRTLQLAENLSVHFLPVDTRRHLTNYKSLFMLELMKFTDVGLFYIDPDIIIKCKWSYFEDWITYGVAVVQEISSNILSPNHPKRARWKQVIVSCGKQIQRELHHYYNGGFCGVSKRNKEFLETWEKIMCIGIHEYGMDDNHFSKKIDQLSMFPVADQDAFNIAAMCSTSPTSDFGPEGMDFQHGGWLMSHATGKPKPWATRYLRNALKGKKASLAQKNYWIYANGIIQTMPTSRVKRKKAAIRFGSLINRFYSRS